MLKICGLSGLRSERQGQAQRPSPSCPQIDKKKKCIFVKGYSFVKNVVLKEGYDQKQSLEAISSLGRWKKLVD